MTSFIKDARSSVCNLSFDDFHIHSTQESSQIEEVLASFWEHRSKDTQFIEDLKESPLLERLIRYDKKFNNKRKVEFESALAMVIRTYPRMLQEPVVKVTKAIAPDFIASFEKVIAQTDDSEIYLHQCFYRIISECPDILIEYTGEYKNSIPSDVEEKKKFASWIYDKLHSLEAKDLHCQLLLIREYGNFFLRPYANFPQFQHLNDGEGMQVLPKSIGEEASKIKMKELWDSSRQAIFSKYPAFDLRRVLTHPEKHQLTKQSGIFDAESTYETRYIHKYCPEIPLHLPGKSVWFVNSTFDFTKKVRYELDMPLIGSQGGRVGLILIPAIVIGGLQGDELRMFNLCAMSFIVSNGHHSLHELKSMYNALNIPYVDGYYKSLFPDGLIEAHPELSELQRDFSDLLK
ncbi:MAG: hypothetical protein COT84_05950 [Chlamydiae bacterium CG10_big_fil_rev_8_21_14_0_10_35_9]|nr:MAG: hypothetical protein COT84_05950 [Chlamydiae bacterium CG10_big_fil_rev_8_21_14_0_10_35_9]